MSQTRMPKRNRERSREAWGTKETVCGGAMRRNVAILLYEIGLKVRRPAGIAKIEACTCPARKGRVFCSGFFSLFASPYSFFVSSFSSSLCLALLSAVLPVPFALETSLAFAFLPLGFVSEIPRRPRHVHFATPLSLFLLPSSSSGQNFAGSSLLRA